MGCASRPKSRPKRSPGHGPDHSNPAHDIGRRIDSLTRDRCNRRMDQIEEDLETVYLWTVPAPFPNWSISFRSTYWNTLGRLDHSGHTRLIAPA